MTSSRTYTRTLRERLADVDWSLVRVQVAAEIKSISASMPKQEPPKTFEQWAMRRHYQRCESEAREEFAHMYGDRTGEFS